MNFELMLELKIPSCFHSFAHDFCLLFKYWNIIFLCRLYAHMLCIRRLVYSNCDNLVRSTLAIESFLGNFGCQHLSLSSSIGMSTEHFENVCYVQQMGVQFILLFSYANTNHMTSNWIEYMVHCLATHHKEITSYKTNERRNTHKMNCL